MLLLLAVAVVACSSSEAPTQKGDEGGSGGAAAMAGSAGMSPTGGTSGENGGTTTQGGAGLGGASGNAAGGAAATSGAGLGGSAGVSSGGVSGTSDGGMGVGGTMAGSGGIGNGGTAGGFVHPGILHTGADLERMKAMVAARAEPYFAGYEALRTHAQSSSSYAMRGPFAEIGRNPDVRKTETENDVNAAYQTALLWAITGNQAYAAKSMEIVNGWSQTLQTVSGMDAILAAGIYGFKLVSAAEILRHTSSGWSEADAARAETMFRVVLYPVIRDFATFANGNWSLACVMTMMAIGVYTNDRATFDRAVAWYQNGTDNGSLVHYVINETGQAQESGRDQTHTQLGLGYLAQSAEIAWNQGIDLYGAVDNRLLDGFEYTASYNLGNSVPFMEYTDTTGKYHHTAISEANRGEFRPIYEMVYNHYKNRRGVDCPYTEQVATMLRPEGAAFQADHPGFGTILFTRPR